MSIILNHISLHEELDSLIYIWAECGKTSWRDLDTNDLGNLSNIITCALTQECFRLDQWDRDLTNLKTTIQNLKHPANYKMPIQMDIFGGIPYGGK